MHFSHICGIKISRKGRRKKMENDGRSSWDNVDYGRTVDPFEKSEGGAEGWYPSMQKEAPEPGSLYTEGPNPVRWAIKNRYSDETERECRGPETLRSHLEGQSDLHQLDLSEQDLAAMNLQERVLAEASLRGSNLSGSNLRMADLRGTDLRGADLSGCDLTGALIDEDTLIDSKTKLHGADVSGLDLTQINLTSEQQRGLKNLRNAVTR
jgi:hypothetical protein